MIGSNDALTCNLLFDGIGDEAGGHLAVLTIILLNLIHFSIHNILADFCNLRGQQSREYINGNGQVEICNKWRREVGEGGRVGRQVGREEAIYYGGCPL